MRGIFRRSCASGVLSAPPSIAPLRMAYQLKQEEIDAKQNDTTRPVPRCGVPAAWWTVICASSMSRGMSSQTTSAVAQTGLKLDARKAPLEVIVVDDALKTPIAN